MAKALLKALKTDMMADLDMAALAQILRSRGRGNDTILAHITPREAALLKKRGGSGTINPDTGLPEFDDGIDIETPAPVEAAPAPAPAPVEAAPAPSAASSDTGGGNFGISTGAPAPSATPDLTGAPSAGQYADYTQAATGPFTASTFGQVQPSVATPVGQQIADTTGPAGAVGLGGTAQAPTTTAPTTSGKDWLGNVVSQLTQPSTLAKLGLTAGLGAYGAYQSNQAKQQAAQATAQKQAIAAPYQQQGQQLIAAANAGQLTPVNQQIIQAQRARLQQASANMGGVGAQQIENQISGLTSQLLNNQYQYGLQVLQIGDNIALGAINSQLQIDNQLAAANKSFYSSLAGLVAGSPSYVQGLNQTKVS